MREIRLHDTMSGAVVALRPRQSGRVGIYACGPTVYSRIHIGNARPFVIFGLLKRFLRHEGYEVTLVINVTDVNDKIYDAARPDPASEDPEPHATDAGRLAPRERGRAGGGLDSGGLAGVCFSWVGRVGRNERGEESVPRARQEPKKHTCKRGAGRPRGTIPAGSTGTVTPGAGPVDAGAGQNHLH